VTPTSPTPGSGSASAPTRRGYAGRTIPNILAVARREFGYRARSRAFRWSTVILVVAGVALASTPTILAYFDRDSTGDRVEVFLGEMAPPAFDVPVALGAILNASVGSAIPAPGQGEPPPRFVVAPTTDLDASRAKVVAGDVVAVLALGRAPNGDLKFDLYTGDSSPISRRNALIRQAAVAVTIQDRLTRAGVSPVDQATLFSAPQFAVLPADPAAEPTDPRDPNAITTSFFVGFGLSIAIFMAIILYGQWIAFSVAEEKATRVMEIVLAAATPFQLLAGKVVGVGALALLQYVIVAVPSLLAVVFQSQISAILLGTAPSDGVPAGLSISTLIVFGGMLVLGFALYASLYAGVASLVSRQEDVNSIIAPLTFVSVGGYLVASYVGTGVLPIDAPIVVALSFVPLFSPYLMLTRYSLDTATPLEVLISMALLLLAIPLALWLAARLYRAGVLLYGQPPTPRTLWRALRAG
jgi:ABC-2 type transport system permease protein